ncbi:hypothetical protein H5A20_21700 [Pectobacterium brasiliense]|uniref:hypothetical protein n=1 Tax=Enterobacterales TaxID=91347 RepID=UPI00135C8771|nr:MULTISPECIES: hypothetical protein [Enterobacterales]MBN3201297.1 hypothetical protein [Pectobacterium brasiliense]
MFNQLEHEALMRLMTYATGHTADSQRIAHWLQEWERAENLRTVKAHVPGLAAAHALDVTKVARAAKRDGARPTTLGRDEYAYNMQNIERAHPLPSVELER